MRTRDLGGTASTTEFADAVARNSRALALKVAGKSEPLSTSARAIVERFMLDEIAQAVLAREEVLEVPARRLWRARASARAHLRYLDELRTTQRHASSIARCSIRSIRFSARSSASTRTSTTSIAAVRAHRIVYASNHKSHTDYLVEPLVLDDNGIRPPLIAAGINLFGGPLGLLHQPRDRRDSDPPQQRRTRRT